MFFSIMLIFSLSNYWNTIPANLLEPSHHTKTTIELNTPVHSANNNFPENNDSTETTAKLNSEYIINNITGIDCGLQDITAIPIREHNVMPNGLTHNQALQSVFNHFFKTPKAGEWESNDLLFYLEALYSDNLGIKLNTRERDLMLCTLLSNSTIEQYTDLATAGLSHYSNQEIYLFKLLLKDKKYQIAHIWITVDRFNGEANIIAIDD